MTAACVDKISETNMREFMLAILEENDKGQRSVGYSDNDIMEIYE